MKPGGILKKKPSKPKEEGQGRIRYSLTNIPIDSMEPDNHQPSLAHLVLDSTEKMNYSQLYRIDFTKTDVSRSRRTSTKTYKSPKVGIKTLVESFLNCAYKVCEPERNFSEDIQLLKQYLSEFQPPTREFQTEPQLEPILDVGKNHIKGISWQNQMRTKLFSENAVPGLSIRDEWGRLGSYIPYELQREKTKPDRGFGIGGRCPAVLGSVAPGPGYYGNDANLHRPETVSKRATTSVPPFEWTPSRSKVQETSPGIAPNTYYPRGYCTADIVDKVVSKRGPYDLFTGPRDSSTIKSYFLHNPTNSKSWPINFPGMAYFLQQRKSSWGNSKRTFALPVGTVTPAPNRYFKHIMDEKRFSKKVPPFNSSSFLSWDTAQKSLPGPGPGRYFITDTLKSLRSKKRKLHNIPVSTSVTSITKSPSNIH